MPNEMRNNQKGLTDYEISCLLIASTEIFAQVASKNDLTHDVTLGLGKRLFNDCIATIKETRKKLS